MPTPKDAALVRAPDAATVVNRTRLVLGELIEFRVRSLPIPPHVLRNFDKVWFHFKAPVFPVRTFDLFPAINSLEEFLGAIDSVYVQMLKNVVQAPTLFRDLPEEWFGPSTSAFTLTDTRTPEDPPKKPTWPNGIYFKEKFKQSGRLKQIEVVVHEAAHFPKNQLIQDNAQPGEENYVKMDSSMALRNAYSYSQFALDCAFNRSAPFSDNE